MNLIKDKIKNFINRLDKKTIFISIVTSLMVLYYINPLTNIELTQWNRTFSSSILFGISISKRVNNFYLLLLVYIPIIFILLTYVFEKGFQYRDNFKNIFYRLSIVLLSPVIIAYISRFNKSSNINQNNMIGIMLGFYLVLFIISILDKKKILINKNVTFLFMAFIIGSVTLNILLRLSNIYICMLIISLVLICYVVLLLKSKISKEFFNIMHKHMCFLAWIPAVIYVVLEIFYLLNEKGIFITRYYTHICEFVAIYMVFTFVIVYFTRKKQISFDTFGYIGTIFSLVITKYLVHTYSLQFDYGDYNFLYELGNHTVAIDTLLNGKIPIIDYFSAHALSDVLTNLIYCFIHSDIKGILVNPYSSAITIIAGFMILYYILKELFDKENALFAICLFPFAVSSIKIVSISFLSVAMFIYIFKNKKKRDYFLFWICVLFSALYVYDEGISLGISCIITYLFITICKKDWNSLKKFIGTGFIVGAIVFALYCAYCMLTGIPIIGRIKEWLSLSLGSNTSWASAIFGDPSSPAFLLAYFVAPICAVIVLFVTSLKYMINKKEEIYVGMAILFAIAEVLFITRSIVFHNLAVCGGASGVLLNFIHWTGSLFVLYQLSREKISEEKRFLTWNMVFGITIILECFLVIPIFPSANNLIEGSIIESNSTKISNDMQSIHGKERITYTQKTSDFINQFKIIFDTLLEDDETFLDFANITSLYMLTNRERPFYVSQSPSLLTDLYSQQSFLDEISHSKIPLAILGTTIDEYTTYMIDVQHNVRYYFIYEYIYKNYRPLVKTGDFAIWCDKDRYDEFTNLLKDNGLTDKQYNLIDYGYDKTKIEKNENGNNQLFYMPFHDFNLNLIPYIWANYDNYNAIKNEEIVSLSLNEMNNYVFNGSQNIDRETGNYLLFEINNPNKNEFYLDVVCNENEKIETQFKYSLRVLSGINRYLIRVSQDSFWEVYNINNIKFQAEYGFSVDNVKILKGD